MRLRASALMLAGAFVCFCAGTTFAQTCPDAGKPIKIGVAEPLTGPAAFAGLPIANAVRMTVDEINAAGGINGRKLELDVGDERNDPKEAANLAQKFTSDPDIIAGITGSSTTSLAAAPIYTAAKVVMLAPISSHPDTTKNSDWVFRIINTQAQLAEPFADFLAVRVKTKRLAFIVTADEFTKANADNVLRVLKEKYPSVELVLNETITPDTRDFRALLTKLQSVKPDTLYLITLTPNDSAVLVRQIRQSGQQYTLVGGSSGMYSPVFLKLAAESADGIYVTSFFDATDQREEAKAFVAKYEKTYGTRPDQWGAFGVDIVNVFKSAAKQVLDSGKCLTRQTLADALRQLPAYEGLTGRKKLTRAGDIETAAPSFLLIDKGKYRVLGPNEP